MGFHLDTTVQVALIAAGGVVAVGVLTFISSKKQFWNPNRAANAAAKRIAYEGLWKLLEHINLSLRQFDARYKSCAQQLKEVNTYFIENSLHFDDVDQKMIGDYIKDLNRVQEALIAFGDDKDLKDYQSTGQFSSIGARDYISAMSDADELRVKIKIKVQKVAGAM
jgi:hypothetical protein